MSKCWALVAASIALAAAQDRGADRARALLGVRWFHGVVILQDQKPFFALTHSTFKTLSTHDLSR